MDQLKENVKIQVKQKMKIKDIIESNVSLGFKKIDVIDRLIIVIGFRFMIPLLIILLFVFGIIFGSILFSYYNNESKIPIQYSNIEKDSNNPQNFVVEYPSINKNGKEVNLTKVDVDIITKGNSYVYDNEQKYYVEEMSSETVFDIDGFYNGYSFKNSFIDNDSSILMRLSQNMYPDDGIVEGYIVERINDFDTKNISAFIFVDSDWKKKMPNTKIFYGSSYQYEKDFIFNELKPGIYMMEIYDDPNRQIENFSISTGGIAVGDLDKQNILDGDVEGKTFMMLTS
jgi:hypothetical protein